MNRNSVMLLFLSSYKDNATDGEYTYNKIYKYNGSQTFEAPTQCLLEMAFLEGNPIEKILCITSKEVYDWDDENNKTKHMGMTMYQYYKKKVEEYCEGKYPVPTIEPIFYDFIVGQDQKPQKIDTGTYDMAVRIYNQFIKQLGKQDKRQPVNVYIDCTGGMRDISFLMTTIVRYLEFSNIRCGKIIYGLFQNGFKQHTIQDIQYIYNMFQMINGVSEFLTTGNATQMYELYSNMKKSDVSVYSQKIDEALESILALSNVLSLCMVNRIEKAVKKMAEKISAIKDGYREGSEKSQIGFFKEVFQSLIPMIEEKMFFFDNDNQSLKYPELIQWCLDNRMMQQAITFYIEKIPEYYNSCGMNMQKFFDAYNVPEEKQSFIGIYQNLYSLVCTVEDGSSMCSEVKKMDTETPEQFLECIQNSGHAQDLAWIRLSSLVRKKFILKGSVDVYGGDIEQKSLNKFINEFCNSKKYLHYCLYDDEEEFNKYREKTKKNTIPNSENDYYTYRKKIKALRRIEEMYGDDAQIEEVCLSIKYYIALKIIRNKVNHAQGDIINYDEEAVKNYYKETGTEIEINQNYENIKNIIKKAISFGKDRI